MTVVASLRVDTKELTTNDFKINNMSVWLYHINLQELLISICRTRKTKSKGLIELSKDGNWPCKL